MLSDREREALHEIEHRLLIEDPDFSQSFDAAAHRMRRGASDLTRWTYTILVVLSSTFAMVLLMVGSPASALVLVMVAALTWEARRRRYNTGRQPRDRR